jgi:diguanylate cyclase (GGDEF)-like protein
MSLKTTSVYGSEYKLSNLKMAKSMSSPPDKTEPNSDFRVKSTLGITLVTLFFLLPLTFNHFYQGRFLLGTGALAIVTLFSVIAWRCYQGHYNPKITFVALIPVIVFFLFYTFQTMAIIAAFWCYPAVLAIYFMLPERQAWIANIFMLAIILPQAWLSLEPSIALRFIVTLIVISAFSAIFIRVITAQQHKLKTQVITDPLTGLFNRMLLQETLDYAIQQHHRSDIPMTILSLDLDHFKVVNDTHGHNAGDAVLRDIGKLLQKRIRKSDKVFRLGGEEFLVLLYDANIEHGRQLGEELRSTIELLQTLPGHPVTTSIGIAALEDDENWEEWMKRCDKNLYRAKLDGRNRITS